MQNWLEAQVSSFHPDSLLSQPSTQGLAVEMQHVTCRRWEMVCCSTSGMRKLRPNKDKRLRQGLADRRGVNSAGTTSLPLFLSCPSEPLGIYRERLFIYWPQIPSPNPAMTNVVSFPTLSSGMCPRTDPPSGQVLQRGLHT